MANGTNYNEDMMNYNRNTREAPRMPVYPGNNRPVTPIAPGGGMPVFPGNNRPVTPIAPEGGMPVFPGNNRPVTPIAPEGGMPVYPGNNRPVTPIAPEGGMPAFPGNNRPVTPIAPGGGIPAYPGPGSGFPPLRPGNQNTSQVRFLNAAANNLPLNISIDNRSQVSGLTFGSVSSYNRVADGFRTVTITSATGPRLILYRKSMPFIAGEKITLVVIISENGVDLVQVSDRGCQNMPRNMGCFRAANMAFANSAFDVMLYGGEAVFTDVRFKENTIFKQAQPGNYEFYITNASRGRALQEIPIIVISNASSANNMMQPLLSFMVNIRAGSMYTAYIIGNTWSQASLRVVVVEN